MRKSVVIVVPLMLLGCGREPVVPTAGTSPSPFFSVENQLDICHVTDGRDAYILISVAAAAVDAHMRHGDGRVGSPVSGLPGMIFDEACEPVRVLLSLFYADPLDDQLQLTPTRQLNPPSGVIDLVGMRFTFSNLTGDYEIELTASAANPFVGGFRINVHLFNPGVGTTAPDPSFFVDEFNDFFLTTPTTRVTITGTDPRLRYWNVGDLVGVCEGVGFVEFGPCLGGIGLPEGVLGFASGVYTFPTPPPFDMVKGLDVLYTAPAGTIAN